MPMKALKYDTNVTVKTFREILPLKEYKCFLHKDTFLREQTGD